MAAGQPMADGRSLRVWSFGNGFNDDRAVPAPVLELTAGQPAAITLTSMMPHTLHPHGLDVDQANDGVPSTSGYVGQAMPMMGDFGRVSDAQSLGTTYTYRFIAPHAGTYKYHCHVDTVLHMEMGMAGTVIVRPEDGSLDRLWTGGPVFDSEYVWHLHTFDSRWHTLQVSGPETADSPGTVRYRPDYFMINGRDGNQTATDPATAIQAATGNVVLVRLVNIGYLPARVSLGGILFTIAATDGRPLVRPITTDTWLVGPGERYDVLFTLPTGDYLATVDYLSPTGTRLLGQASAPIAGT